MLHRRTKNIFLLLLFAAFFAECRENFLDREPYGAVTEELLSSNLKGCESLLIAAYSSLDGFAGWDNGNPWGSAASNWIYGSMVGGDAHKGSAASDCCNSIAPLEMHRSNAENAYLESKWRVLYDGIHRANTAIRAFRTLPGLDDGLRAIRIAEARFLRAHYHFEAKKMWNMVPFIDETVTDTRIPNDRSIWPDIESDLIAAADALPWEQPEIGRATKGAALALLGKAYLYEHKFAEAKNAFDRVIASGQYSLTPDFHDNFNPATRNNSEGVFVVQQAVNEGTEGENGNIGEVLNYPHGGGPGACCGFHQPSQNLVNAFRTDAGGLPLLDNYNQADAFAPDLWIPSSASWDAETEYYKGAHISRLAPSSPHTEKVYKSLIDNNKDKDPMLDPNAWELVWTEDGSTSLDPRLDWTAGRRSIPYLDWGNHPGIAWIRDQAFGGPYSPKKNAYYKNQEGALTNVSGWHKGYTAQTIKLIRYADVLLMAAECEVELGNFEKARDYVNTVRQRAANPEGFVKNDDGTPAANYQIGLYTTQWTDPDFARKAVRFERRIELAMEGHRFFDLVRWGVAAVEKNAYFAVESTKRFYLTGATFTAGKDEYFPIPAQALRMSVKEGVETLKQNPEY